MIGRIFDIQRFSLHDGPGIRTTVFMKGCSLSCPWCHNPEGLSFSVTPQFFSEKCISCGACRGEHTLENTELCPAEALCASGRDVTCDELFAEVMRDRDFYGEDGGVTFSGGECLLQADFVSEMLERFKESGITTAVDTAGYVPYESIGKTLPYTDYYLYDIKCVSAELHRNVIGKDNALILENFEKLSASGAKIFVRVPVIPDFNDNEAEMEKIAETVAGKEGVLGATLMPYHTLGKNKYETLGLVATYNTEKRIDSKVLEDYKEIFRKKGVFIE